MATSAPDSVFVPHAIERAKEHFDIDWTRTDLENIADLVDNQKTVLAARCQSGVERHIVCYNGNVIPIIIDRRTRTIVTTLPKCAHKPIKHKRRRPASFRRFNNDNEDYLDNYGSY